MNYILDTNILLSYLRKPNFSMQFRHIFGFGEVNEHIFSTSIVTIGELESFVLQRKWGLTKIQELKDLIAELTILDINSEDVIARYAEIDAYSQGKLDNKPLPLGMSARNMGKNDIWIAATASATEATLLTTDLDFNHLQTVFANIQVLIP